MPCRGGPCRQIALRQLGVQPAELSADRCKVFGAERAAVVVDARGVHAQLQGLRAGLPRDERIGAWFGLRHVEAQRHVAHRRAVRVVCEGGTVIHVWMVNDPAYALRLWREAYRESSAMIRGRYWRRERAPRSTRRDAGVYCGLSQVPTFLPASLIVMFVPWDVAWIAPV